MNRLLQDWSFTQVGGGEGTKDGEWLKVSQFPTSVHVELLKLKKIPDPFIGLQEWDVQWVGEAQWAFKTTFNISDEELKKPNADLVFDGVDTFASVVLNGNDILQCYNQFLSYRNELVLNFDSAYFKGRELEKKHGKFNLWNGDSSRLHVRKAQYNYGWDWGPVLMVDYRPMETHHLSLLQNRITDLDVRAQVSETLDATLNAKVSFDKQKGFASFVLKGPDGSIEASDTKMPTDHGVIQLSFNFPAEKLQLWYPVSYGEQSMYTAEVEIADLASSAALLRKCSRFQNPEIGFRRIRVVQEKLVDQVGLSFLFEVNNIRIFCGGSNWIPADSFLTEITEQRYRAWLQLLVDGNQNMIRVWGGGIYEADAFYDICDVLVWQDFMFGCGQYPAYQSFLDSVKTEAEQNVRRLRHHPSVVIFDYQIAESLNLELDYSDEKSDYLQTNFPARHIYERLLPAVMEELSDIYYHRASPYSGHGKPTTDKTYGDLHQWNVWHGSQEPWHKWDTLAGRFVSEFGMESYPNIRTVDYWLDGEKSERYPQSRYNNNHNKADGFERRLELYLVENFKHSFEMESYVYHTQVMQAETLAAAYRLWRRNWAGKGREYTAGALVWQINDCWPVTSWSIVDYFLRPKPAYFTIARELRAFTVGMTRKDKQTFPNELSSAQFTIETVLEIWGTNSTLADKKATLEVTSFDLYSDCWRDKWSKEIVLKSNSSTELFKGALPGQPTRTKNSQTPKAIIVSARLLDDDGQVLARYSNWPEPFKFIDFPSDTGVKAKVFADGESVTLTTNKPIKGIVLDADGPDVKWSDQAIDLVPDDPQTIKAIGLNGREVKLRFLGDGTA
ncbi:glycoside hydrolase family 2 protein [Mycena sp. CBHHK59/15]|nr:glycoside hydrolase family 2 protein [Mycena sp. CBHHK59/15]